MKKPPLGLTPRYIHDIHVQKWVDLSGGITMTDFFAFKDRRVEEIQEAILRYEEVGMRIPSGWIQEEQELLEQLENQIF